MSPILDQKPRPVATLRYLFTPVMPHYGMLRVALAALTGNYLTPSIQRMTTLHPKDGYSAIYGRGTARL